MQFIGKIFTDEIPPSEYRLSVIPNSIANSVRNQKNKHRRSYRWRSAPKTISRENYTDGICSSVFSMVITDGMAIDDCGMGSKYFRILCKLPTDISVSDCGMGGNVFATLGKVPTSWFRL